MFECFATGKRAVLNVLHAARAWLKALPPRRVPLWTAAAGLGLGVGGVIGVMIGVMIGVGIGRAVV